MDKAGSRKELSEDMTRESLIAISYVSPDNDPTDVMILPGKINGENDDQPLDNDGEDKLRSELISISDLPPPEENVLPPLPPLKFNPLCFPFTFAAIFAWTGLPSLARRTNESEQR
ncbi:Unknown protein [Striga hermonthica]|uniref:Uncharacterized protein n=1 Tax=Striga hermonthica TaxID=68872 RepID=A0A9N7N577_STRHE|nr:Unknown protein [Striga hermonthica]